MSRPIEPGCRALCRTKGGTNIVIVLRNATADVFTFFKPDKLGRWWEVRSVSGPISCQNGPASWQLCVAECCLTRLDDDPDAAEPRIVEKEIEHA